VFGSLRSTGAGQPLLLLHPNGFCAGLFEPLVRALDGAYRAIAVDLRGHGASDAPTDAAGYAFVELARDVVAVLDAMSLERVVALGQSLGGGVAALVDRERPGLIERMLLCEAVAFPLLDPPTGGPMSDTARRRRAHWTDRPAMIAAYRTKPPLSELAPDALDAYVRWGTIGEPDGTVRLACSPETEAIIFEISTTPHGAPAAFEHLDSLGAPATVLAGDRSYLPREFFTAQAERVGTDLVLVTGGHFMVQEDARRAAGWVREYLTPP